LNYTRVKPIINRAAGLVKKARLNGA